MKKIVLYSDHRQATLLPEESNYEIARHIAQVLASNMSLLTATQYAHWNITGPTFIGIHKLLDELYEARAQEQDVLAERIRSLGYFVPATLDWYAQHGELHEVFEQSTAEQLIDMLSKLDVIVCKRVQDALALASEYSDDVTVDILTELLVVHEKQRWLLLSNKL